MPECKDELGNNEWPMCAKNGSTPTKLSRDPDTGEWDQVCAAGEFLTCGDGLNPKVSRD